MKQLEVYLQDRPIGMVKIDCVRGRETWMFAYDPSFVKASNPNPDGGDHALDLGDPVKDADYYRLTQAEARRQYEEIRITAANLLK